VSRVLTQSGIEAEALDARRLIITDDKFGAAHWLESETLPRVRSFFANFSRTAVVTGFIASTLDGITTTLGRGGSDFTAGILGCLHRGRGNPDLDDVDGIMSADQRPCGAFVIPEISYSRRW
jgi:aspartokinase/homoserine dehydrogenase 1